ncbi:Multidrug transporter MdfA [Candidatus Arsenophonus lipoptenae]|uniref:Multidrug transporter MdfA n=1 Tax=Candidatus Arsenophonus lipoptenae TaxID=634113 RepID=A0A109Q8K7_9GAMM|nr:MFS transporter [Candidatus Arsenophonus lipoptenae]AMA64635.1 Multidrug transporter MdfA [Candidatus Arsenophonus lipoptenae]
MHINYLSKYDHILFPLSLVLFEFTVYIANDMIQPAMLEIVKSFHVGVEWVPTSLTAYLAGGIFLQWLFGPLSDKKGRRPVMLLGVLFFIFSCLSILFVSNIKQFIFMRFLQGIGLCFIGTIGYATIQESFTETICVKIIALMANIALIAPLLGPLIGATLINILSWQTMFIIFAILALTSFIGLFFFMPETVLRKGEKLSIYMLWCDYKLVFKNLLFIYGAFAIGFVNLPLLSWIALSPLILINKENLQIFTYALLQIPVFGGLIIGNITLSYLTKKLTLIQLIKLGGNPIVIGLLISLFSVFYPSVTYLSITVGLSLYSFGLGIINSCLTRLTLFSSNISKGTVSAAMGIISMIIFVFGLEISKKVYLLGDTDAFNLLNLLSGLCWLILIILFIKKFLYKKNISNIKD